MTVPVKFFSVSGVMDGGFDPYHKWLGISVKDQPPNHYRLLGIDNFESDPEVISATFNRQRSHLLTYQNGPYKEFAQRILQELVTARVCLTDPLARRAYDLQLQAMLPEAAAMSEPAAYEEPTYEAASETPRRSTATRSQRPARNAGGPKNPDDPTEPKEKLWFGIGRQGQIAIVAGGSIVFLVSMLYLAFSGGGSSKSRTQSVPQSFPNVQSFNKPAPSKPASSKNTSKTTTKPKKK